MIRTDLGASLEDLEWTVNAYTLTFAVFLLTDLFLAVAACLLAAFLDAPDAGLLYNPTAAGRAWTSFEAFLAEVFG